MVRNASMLIKRYYTSTIIQLSNNEHGCPSKTLVGPVKLAKLQEMKWVQAKRKIHTISLEL
jgi:hypothetical protein